LSSRPRFEVKACDQSSFGGGVLPFAQTPTASTNVLLMNDVPPGTGSWQRLGQTIRMKSLAIVFQIVPTGNTINATQPSDFLRVLIVYDRQSNNGTTSWANMVAAIQPATASTFNTISGPMDPISIAERERFLVLADWRIPTPPVATGGGNDASADEFQMASKGFTFKKFIPLRGLECRYVNSASWAGNITDINTGAIHMWCASWNAPNLAAWGMRYSMRLRYTD